MAKSILKRRATHPDQPLEPTHDGLDDGKDRSLWFEGKRLRFSSLGSPLPPSPARLPDDGPGQITHPATGTGTWLDEETRQQMAVLGRASGKRKRKGSEVHPVGGELGASSSTDELELVDRLSKLRRFTQESQEVNHASRTHIDAPRSFFSVSCRGPGWSSRVRRGSVLSQGRELN